MTSKRQTSQLIVGLLLVASLIACPNDPLCQKCGSNGACLSCVYSYPGASGICTALTTIIPGCYQYSASNTCSMCQDGYYQNLNPSVANNTCTVLSPSINSFCRLSYTNANSCTHCMFGVIAVGNTCQPGNNCNDPNCDTCYAEPVSGNQFCWVCQPDFYLWTGVSPAVCIPNSNQLVGCRASNSLVACSTCGVGYYWQNGVCVANTGTNFGSAQNLALSGLLLLIGLFKL